MFALSVTVNAAILVHITSDLTISGNEAEAYVSVLEKNKDISVTMKLWEGNSLVGTWSDTGTTFVTMSETFSSVQAGKTYILKITGTINGVAFPEVQVTRYT